MNTLISSSSSIASDDVSSTVSKLQVKIDAMVVQTRTAAVQNISALCSYN